MIHHDAHHLRLCDSDSSAALRLICTTARPRAQVSPNEGFWRALVLFEKTLFAPSGLISQPSKGVTYEGLLMLQDTQPLKESSRIRGVALKSPKLFGPVRSARSLLPLKRGDSSSTASATASARCARPHAADRPHAAHLPRRPPTRHRPPTWTSHTLVPLAAHSHTRACLGSALGATGTQVPRCPSGRRAGSKYAVQTVSTRRGCSSILT